MTKDKGRFRPYHTMFKNKHFLLDILIAILVVAVIILADHLVMNFRSKSADYYGSADSAENNGGIEMTKITQGEHVFLPILNFHHIGQAPARASKVDQSFYLEPAQFEKILQDLIAAGYHFYFVSELAAELQNGQIPKEKPLAITFDDGNEDFYTAAFPILEKYNLKSSMYVMTGVKGQAWLTADQMLELDSTGLVEFGSHTVWHPKLTKAKPDEIIYELTKSREYLEKLLNKKISGLAYPFGLYNDEIKKQAEAAGYLVGLTFDQDAWQNSADLLSLTRISLYPGLDIIKFLDKLSREGGLAANGSSEK